MKNFIAVCLCTVSLSACKGNTEYGDCVGIAGDENPSIHYEISVRNAILSAIFIETVFAPVLWATSYAKCPNGRKQP